MFGLPEAHPRKYQFRVPKNLDKYIRPKMELHLSLAHGYAACFFVSDEEGVNHGSSYSMECICRTLAVVKRIRAEQGLPMCRHLCIQVDNTVSACKNSWFCLWLGVLLRKWAFDTVQLSMLRKGHTHEDVDFIFSLVLARVLRKVNFMTPGDLIEAIPAGMGPLLNAKEYQCFAEHVTHTRDFQLSSVGSMPYNCFQTRHGITGPHSFAWKLRFDDHERRNLAKINKAVIGMSFAFENVT